MHYSPWEVIYFYQLAIHLHVSTQIFEIAAKAFQKWTWLSTTEHWNNKCWGKSKMGCFLYNVFLEGQKCLQCLPTLSTCSICANSAQSFTTVHLQWTYSLVWAHSLLFTFEYSLVPQWISFVCSDTFMLTISFQKCFPIWWPSESFPFLKVNKPAYLPLNML